MEFNFTEFGKEQIDKVVPYRSARDELSKQFPMVASCFVHGIAWDGHAMSKIDRERFVKAQELLDEIDEDNRKARISNVKNFQKFRKSILDMFRAMGCRVDKNAGGLYAAYSKPFDELESKFLVNRSPTGYFDAFMRRRICNTPFDGRSIDDARVWNSKYGIDARSSGGPLTLVKIYDEGVKAYEREESLKLKNNNHLIAAVKYLIENGIDHDTKECADQIIQKAEDHAKQAYLTENFSDGDVIDIDDNYCECATYIVGEYRCSCGSRRISLTIEGDLINGYYANGEPY